MKIVMLGHKTVPSRDGGIEVVVDELATHLAAKGEDVTLFKQFANEEIDMPNLIQTIKNEIV